MNAAFHYMSKAPKCEHRSFSKGIYQTLKMLRFPEIQAFERVKAHFVKTITFHVRF